MWLCDTEDILSEIILSLKWYLNLYYRVSLIEILFICRRLNGIFDFYFNLAVKFIGNILYMRTQLKDQ